MDLKHKLTATPTHPLPSIRVGRLSYQAFGSTKSQRVFPVERAFAGKALGMSLQSLFRICARQGDEMSSAIAKEAQTIVYEAAKPVRPGSTVKSQIRQAARALGYPDGSWRITAAWYGHAGSFSASAIRELQDRYLAWREAEARRTVAASSAERARQMALDRDLLERCRRDHLAQLAAIERRLAVLGSAGPDA